MPYAREICDRPNTNSKEGKRRRRALISALSASASAPPVLGKHFYLSIVEAALTNLSISCHQCVLREAVRCVVATQWEALTTGHCGSFVVRFKARTPIKARISSDSCCLHELKLGQARCCGYLVVSLTPPLCAVHRRTLHRHART